MAAIWVQGVSLAKTTLLSIILFANIAWLLNPHACCPREPLNELDVLVDNKSKPACCSMLHDQPATDEEIQQEEDPTDTFTGTLIVKESQLSKGVHNWVSNSIPTSASLLQFLQNSMICEVILFDDSELPESAVIPTLKKPPRI